MSSIRVTPPATPCIIEERGTLVPTIIRLISYGFLLLLLWGCATPKSLVPPEWVEPIIEFNADRTLTCKDPAEPGCHIPTPFRDSILKRDHGVESVYTHFVNLLNIGDEALLIRIHLIRAAKRSIYIQQFIWADDECGHYIGRELVKAARRGVDVKVINDQPFVGGSAENLARVLLASKYLQIKLYNPTFNQLETSHLELASAGLTDLSGINQRMHSKLLVVDEEFGIVGGRNHENMYFDRDPKYDFKDRDILVIGPEVQGMVNSFFDYWNYKFSVPAQYLQDVREQILSGVTPYDLSDDVPQILVGVDRDASDYDHIKKLFVNKMFRVDGRVQFYADSPGKRNEKEKEQAPTKDTHTGMLTVIGEANSFVLLQTPYLIFSRDAFKFLKKITKGT